MNITYILIILSVLILLLLSVLFYYRYRTQQQMKDSNISLPPTVKANDWDNSVKLSCGNMQFIFRRLGVGFWLLAILMLVMAMSVLKDPDLSVPGKAVANYFAGAHAFIYLPVVFIIFLFYFKYNRTKISWGNGLLIDDEPVMVSRFYFRRMIKGINFIYLRSGNRLWILAPTTSQDNRKYQDQVIVKRDQAFNETQMKQLQANLLQAGATEQRMRFFPLYITLGFAAFVISIICVLMILS